MKRSLRRYASLLLVLFAACTRGSSGGEKGPTGRTLEEYRQFRSTAIDLLGRMPNRAEIGEFEKTDFKLDAWVDKHLSDPTYAARMSGIYMDLLRLEPNLTFGFMPWQLYRVELQTDDGPVYVYYRENQRRGREETDSEFCLTSDEIGVIIRPRLTPVGTMKKVSKEALEKATVLVKPWWLYHDYKSADPHERYGEGWAKPDAEFKPYDSLLKEPDGKPTEQIRICREEAQPNDTGHIYASGRKKADAMTPPKGTPAKEMPAKGAPPKGATPPPAPGAPKEKREKLKPGELPPGGRFRPPPLDKPYAVTHAGEEVACATRLALDMSIDCGCGAALERCLPSDGDGQQSAGFSFPEREPLGASLPLDTIKQPAQRWFPYWWSREAVQFLTHLFESDSDFREILTSKETFVNGPLAQFYRSVQKGNCCGPEAGFGMTEQKEPLIDPDKMPADLLPHDVSTWKLVPDRGAHAAGILTMPIFLEKYASARARGAALYNVFLCKSFVAENAKLEPSTEPNLMVRPGCSSCHATLEPLAAYFTRIEPSSFIYLPQAQFPAKNPTCKKDAKGKLTGACNALYDVAFVDEGGAMLRSAYGSPAHADAGAVGAAHDIVAMPEFASCAVERVTSSLLGRATVPSDAALLEELTTAFKKSGYRMKTVVRGVLRSDAYRNANSLSSSEGGSK